MEFVGGGDLSDKITELKKKRSHLKESIIWNYLIQILQGLSVLHEMKIMHRDIKTANIFLTEDYRTVKLGDMNVAIVAKNNLASTQIGTPYYLAPEIWNNKMYDNRCDVFSLGCVGTIP
jgi:NIMA (never in mitosis gene a)-related kinase